MHFDTPTMEPPPFAVIIRFKNSAATLPMVLATLRLQTVQPAYILGVDSGATDGSDVLMREAGAAVVQWTEAYHHARVLNFAVAQCPQPLVLVLSSHTVLPAPDTIAKMLAAMADPQTACVSGKWSQKDDYSDAITFEELRRTGLRFCSIYSNSFGMFRRSYWEEVPFDESVITMEDGVWAVEQTARGRIVRRLAFPFEYGRAGATRDFSFAAVTFHLAARHGLRVGWLGWKASLWACLRGLCGGTAGTPWATHCARLRAALFWRFARLQSES